MVNVWLVRDWSPFGFPLEEIGQFESDPNESGKENSEYQHHDKLHRDHWHLSKF
jgi:hypothetical protein